MSITRSVRPTDLVALVSLDGRVYRNEARIWERLGCKPEGPSLLESALPPWFSFATGRNTWISVQGQALRGLVSARKRGNRAAWEVECLIAATDHEQILLDLFDRLTADLGSAGALKIFLRLDAGSDLLPLVRRAGFVPYLNEFLLRLDGEAPSAALADDLAPRPRESADAFALYQLYNVTVPEHVRRLEAPTFHQWQAMAEKRTAGRAKRDLVVRRIDQVLAHVRSCREGGMGRIDLCLHPCLRDQADGLISLAIASVGSTRPVLCLLPAYAEWLQARLEAAGFRVDGEYVVLIKRTAVPLAASRPRTVHVPLPRPLAVV